MGVSPRLTLLARAGAGAALVTLGIYTAHLGLGLGGSETDSFFNDFVYNWLEFSAALACFLRAAFVREERLPWIVMGIGLLSYFGGDVYWTLFLSDQSSPPFPSIADGLYLLFYPASYITIVLLVKARVRTFRASLWLDGALAALAVAACTAALVVQPILDTSSGSAAAVTTNLAYPIGDITLLAIVVAVFGLSGWRPGRAWILIGAGLVLGGAADAIYLVQTARETYQEGTLLDALWPASLILIGLAAWQPRRIRDELSLEGWRAVVVPVLSAVVALALMTFDHFERLNLPALVLTAATLAVACARMALSFSENQRMLAASRKEALTDAL